MTDDTARRERAETFIDSLKAERGAYGYPVDWEYNDVLNSYLAGAREEAAIKDDEIAALREAVRRTYRSQSDGSVTVTETDGFSEVNADLDGIESAVRRALEEKP